MEWVNKITEVISSLLNTHILEQVPFSPIDEKHHPSIGSEAMSNGPISHSRNLSNDMEKLAVGVSQLLREIPGNDQCADCGAPDPDWASLNLGILICIECSGAHRNFGVHISKEELLSVDNGSCRKDMSDCSPTHILKPSSHNSFSKEEKYIQMKYAEKQLISLNAIEPGLGPRASALWKAVRASNLREAYRLIAVSDASFLNTTFDEIQRVDSSGLQESLSKDAHKLDPAACPRIKSGEPENCLRGCSLLHLACRIGNAVMIELLLLFGADVNMRDFHGRTPLHHCIAKQNNELAKYLLRRGARRLIKDWGGLTALERAMELGAITDE